MLEKVMKLARYDAFRLFGLACIVWLVEQVISRMVEQIVWGKAFVHWFDVAFTLALFAVYVVCADHLAGRLIVIFGGSVERSPEGDKS